MKSAAAAGGAALPGELAGFRGAAYLCSVSPGASLGISETETEVLGKETRARCERDWPACGGRSRAPRPRGSPAPTARKTRTRFRGSDKCAPDLLCRLRASAFSVSHFMPPENEINTEAHAHK